MIKLNLDLPSLERLIGGDTEVEIAIREGIVQSFAKRHLKAIVNTGVLEPYLEKIAKATLAELEKTIPLKVRSVGHRWNSRNVFELGKGTEYVDKLREAIQKRATELGQKVIDDVFQEAWDDLRTACLERIDQESSKVAALIASEVEKKVTSRFEREVQLEVNRRIKLLAQQSS